MTLPKISEWGRIGIGILVAFKAAQVFSFKKYSFFWTDAKYENPKVFAIFLMVLAIYLLWPLRVKLSPKNINRIIRTPADRKRIKSLCVEIEQKRKASKMLAQNLPRKNYRYSTSEKNTPLDLDLKSFAGGGRSPSQYYGETHDGLKVYGRYRYGSMEVRVAGAHETQSTYNWQGLLDISIGSQYDGFISLTQFCKIAGITVNGVLPKGHHEPEELASEHDLTGVTTFYEFYNDCTLATQNDILDEIFSWKDVIIIEQDSDDETDENVVVCKSRNDLTQSYIKIIIGTLPTEAELVQLDRSIISNLRHTVIQMNLAKKEYVLRGHGAHQLAEEVSAQLGRRVSIANYAENGGAPECPYGRISMSSNYKSDNKKADADIARIDELYQRFFPSHKRIWVNILTGKIHSEEFLTADKRLAEWANPSEDRWLNMQWALPRSNNIPTGAYLELSPSSGQN